MSAMCSIMIDMYGAHAGVSRVCCCHGHCYDVISCCVYSFVFVVDDLTTEEGLRPK